MLVTNRPGSGLSRDEIQVETTDDTLTIQGERKEEKKDEREGYSYSECSYGRFYRAIPLPFHPEPQARRIEVTSGPTDCRMIRIGADSTAVARKGPQGAEEDGS